MPAARRTLWLALLLCGGAAGTAAAQNVQQEIKLRIEAMRESGSVIVAGRAFPRSELVALAYERRGFVPIWSDPERRATLRRALDGLRAEGLDPGWYHAAELASFDGDGAAARADADLLHTIALLEAARDLRFGRITADALRTRRESDLRPEQLQLLAEIVALSPAEALARMRPNHFVYRGMTAALDELLRVQERRGWTAVPHVSLKAGSTDSTVLLLRRRLIEEGDLQSDAAHGIEFDSILGAAVASWQHRHGLNPDSVVGPATLRELAVPLEDRIQQLRINLERARWVLHDLAETFVAVNAAGALVYFVRDGVVLFEARAIVGKTYTRTPMFTAQMRYIDINPTWTVPPGIVHEVLSAVRRDRGWLAAQNMQVLDRSGRVLRSSSIDFSRYSGSSFPYVFRQEPGPLNPLGGIKFVFPNRYNVYLHDTPARQLFAQEERLFSHGCIRVQNPVALAELVLNDPLWSADRIRAAIATGVTRTVPLPVPVPVLVQYWTAAADLHGELHFYRDVYGRDAPLSAALGTWTRP